MTLAITRTDLTAEDLRRAARVSKHIGQARRRLVLALVPEGRSRTEAAESSPSAGRGEQPRGCKISGAASGNVITASRVTQHRDSPRMPA